MQKDQLGRSSYIIHIIFIGYVYRKFIYYIQLLTSKLKVGAILYICINLPLYTHVQTFIIIIKHIKHIMIYNICTLDIQITNVLTSKVRDVD